MRTSGHEVADACGIQSGSRYHHFDSNEDIFVDLVERYQADLHRVAETALLDDAYGPSPLSDQVGALGLSIAECAMRYRAALLLTFYETPAGASRRLVKLARASAIRGVEEDFRSLSGPADRTRWNPSSTVRRLSHRRWRSSQRRVTWS